MKNLLRSFPVTPAREPGCLQPHSLLRAACFGLLLILSPSSSVAIASEQKELRTHEPQFKYAGGTEGILPGCAGTLQITSSSLTYSCAPSSLEIPYGAIEIMQYRADVTRHVRKLKVKWHVPPPMGGGHNNRYFTLVYRVSGATHVLVLEVPNDEMRTYLAEIDLKCGRRVDVQRHEDYE